MRADEIFNNIKIQAYQFRKTGENPKAVLLGKDVINEIKNNCMIWQPGRGNMKAALCGMRIFESKDPGVIQVLNESDTEKMINNQRRKNLKRDLTELDKLEMYLEGRFRYERTDREGRVTAYMGKEFIISDFHKILVYKDGNELFDAICHYGSYGAEQGLLEIMGEALTENGDVVEGNLTADEIIRRLKKFEDKVHELKILPKFYEDIFSRDKSFELRKKDRDYKVGDKVCLREWKPETGYTGRKMTFRIRYIYEGTGEYGLEEGYCILGIKGV